MVARPGTLQATFNSGEVARELYQRNDVKQFYAAAATMQNVEPVPQGGFRLLDRSRDIGAQRGQLSGLGGTLSAPGGSMAGGSVVATFTFAAAAPLSIVRFAYLADIDADARLIVQYRSAADGVWRDMSPAYGLRKAGRLHVAAFPPGTQPSATAARLVLTAGAAVAVTVTDFYCAREIAAPVDAQLVPFAFSTAQPFMIVLAGNGVADIYRNGAYIASAWHRFGGEFIARVVPLQRLETLLLFFEDAPVVRIVHGSAGDHEWNTDEAPFVDVPTVDLGGTYATVTEHWQIALRWPTASGGTAAGYVFIVTVDAQDTTAIGIPPGSPTPWATVAADLQGKLRALSTVGTGCTVSVGYGDATGTVGGLQILDILFDGVNAGSQFTVSAKFINTADAGANALRITTGDPGGEPLFSPGRGYPTCGLFYQDRLIQGGFRSKPGAVLASPTGDYFSGTIDVEAASGGILLNLDTDGAEKIQRLARSKHLVIFTSDAEYYISDRVVRRDQPVTVVESSRNGSCPTVPICSTETALLYVSKARSLVYTATYDDVAQAYVSTPLSLLARHIIKGINGAALQRPNDYSDAARYYLTRDDGVMPIGLLIASQDVTAFVQWVTDGTVKAVGIDGANRVYLSVERMIAGVPGRRIEWLEPGLLVDGAVSQTFGAPQAVVTGLSIHEGATVWAIADGYSLGPFVVAGGAITLPYPASSVTVGRWTPPVVTTLPLPRDVGPRIVLERPCRVFSVMANLIGTTSIAIGANGVPPEDVPLYRAGMPTDLPQQPVTEWLALEGLDGFSIEGQVTITQRRPGTLQVAALVLQART